jgi:hypothetical protein
MDDIITLAAFKGGYYVFIQGIGVHEFELAVEGPIRKQGDQELLYIA